MDRRIGGRPLTRTSDVRHVSRSPSPRSSYRSDSQSRSPSPYISSDSSYNGATRRRPASPVRRRAVEEDAYFAYQAARHHHRDRAILADDSPYIPPSNRPAPIQRDIYDRNPRVEDEIRRAPAVEEQHYREVQRPQDARLAAHHTRVEERGPEPRSKESEASDTDSVHSRVSGTGTSAPPKHSDVEPEHLESRKRARDIVEQDIPIIDDDPFPPSPPPSQPQNFNPERYPAYDENARRIGLDHLRFSKRAKGNSDDRSGDHYLPRTHSYPVGVDNTHAPSSDASSRTRRAVPTPPPLAPEPMEEIDQLAGDDLSHGGAEGSQNGNGKRSSKRTGPLADATGIPDSTPHVRGLLGLEDAEQVGLQALADPPPGEKPTYPYPLLIQLAILGSPKKRLTLAEIYSCIEERFEWFKKTPDKAWQGSIRHTLSLKSIFRSVSRPITEPGKGNYWMVDHTQGDGNKRTRKRNPRPKKADQVRPPLTITLKRPAPAVRREEEESTPTDDDYDSDLMTLDDANIDPQLRGRQLTNSLPQGSSSGGYGFDNHLGASNSTSRPVAVPFTPPTVSSASPSTVRPTQSPFGRPTFGSSSQIAPPYQGPLGPVNPAIFVPPSFGSSSSSSGNRQSYSPASASSAPSPPLSTLSGASRPSTTTTYNGNGYTPMRPSFTQPPNPFGLRHVGPTQSAWHKSAGRADDISSGDDSD